MVPLMAAFAAGLLAFVSPCILPLVPIYLSLLAGSATESGTPEQKARSLRRAALGFVLGLSIVFVALGMVASLVGGFLSQQRGVLLLIGGGFVALFGLKLLGVLRIPYLDREARPLLTRVPALGGFRGGVVFGAAFALGWTPCVGPVLGAVLTYTASSSASALWGGAQLLAFAAGLSLPLLLAAQSAPRALSWLKPIRSWAPVAQRVTGALLVAVGALLMTNHLGWVVPSAGPATAHASVASQPGASCERSGACQLNLAKAAGRGELAATDGPRMVEFMSGHCTVCKHMRPLVHEAEQRCRLHPGGVLQINVDSSNGAALAQRFKVHVVPTFMLLDETNQESSRLVGEQSLSTLEAALYDVAGAQCATRTPPPAGAASAPG